MTFTMYDSIELDQIPSDAEAVAGYVGGRWPTFPELARRFPKARRLSIAVNASEDAECLDVESGDATPEQAPGWVRRQMGRGIKRPVLYASLSVMPQVLDALTHAGISHKDVRLWVAHYTGQAHLPSGFDACQYTDHARGRNLDASICSEDFLPSPDASSGHPAAAEGSREHYDWFDRQRRQTAWGELSEHDAVTAYDRLRQHPHRNTRELERVREQLGWFASRLLTVCWESNDLEGREFYRRWRFEQLRHRALGLRAV